MLAGDLDEVTHLLSNRLFAFQVIEVPRVVAKLLDERSDLLRQSVIFLKIDDQVRVRPRLAHDSQRGNILRIVDSDADHIGAGLFQQLDLADGGVDVLRFGGSHRLNGDRI